MAAHQFDDTFWCTRCWRRREDIVNDRLTCELTNVVPLEHHVAQRHMDALADQIWALLAVGTS